MMEENEKKQTEEWKVVNPKKKKENKKQGIGVKILKSILVLFAIIAVAYTIIVIRNYIILKKIAEKAKYYVDSANYSYEAVQYQENQEEAVNSMKVVKKDSIEKISMGEKHNNLTFWKNKSTNEGLIIIPMTKVCVQHKANELIGGGFPRSMASYDEKMYQKQIALTSIIGTDKVDGQECYVINYFGSKEWVSKETGLLIKIQNGYTVENGKDIPNYTIYTNWKINEVTDEQVAKPDLTGYTQK